MLEIEDFIITQGYDGRKYQDLNIELINNTEEEIRDLIIEINDRIDGVWIETEEDKELQRKYQDIFDKYCLKKRYAESEVLKARVGAMFLRKNPYLLENIEI